MASPKMIAAHDKAKELGAKSVQAAISWVWANDWPSPAKAKEFIRWLNDNGYEHRGYYPALPNADNPNLRVDGVRFRKILTRRPL